jgi:hypothetical protein
LEAFHAFDDGGPGHAQALGKLPDGGQLLSWPVFAGVDPLLDDAVHADWRAEIETDLAVLRSKIEVLRTLLNGR